MTCEFIAQYVCVVCALIIHSLEWYICCHFNSEQLQHILNHCQSCFELLHPIRILSLCQTLHTICCCCCFQRIRSWMQFVHNALEWSVAKVCGLEKFHTLATATHQYHQTVYVLSNTASNCSKDSLQSWCWLNESDCVSCHHHRVSSFRLVVILFGENMIMFHHTYSL